MQTHDIHRRAELISNAFADGQPFTVYDAGEVIAKAEGRLQATAIVYASIVIRAMVDFLPDCPEGSQLRRRSRRWVFVPA